MVSIAKIVDTVGVEVVPETRGFAAELRADVSEAMAAATAGQDKTVRVRVTTDVDTAEKQIRAGIANVQRAAEQMLQRIQLRSTALVAKMQAQLIKFTAKIREQVQKTRDKITQILAPFWARLRTAQNMVQTGWLRIGAAASRAADTVRSKFDDAMSTVTRGWQRVVDGAERAASRIAVRFEPALTRVRRGIEAIGRGWDTVQDAGQRAFSGIERFASATMTRLARGWELQNRPLRVLRAYGQATFRIIGEAASEQFEKVRAVGERAFTRVQAAGERASNRISSGFSRIVTTPLRDFKRGLDDISLGFDKSASRATHFGVITGVGLRLAASRVVELTRGFANFTDRVTGGAGLVRGSFNAIGNSVRAVGREADNGGKAFQRLGTRIEKSGRLGKVAGGLFSGVGKIMEGLSGSAGSLTGSLQKVGEGFLDIGKSALSAAGPILSFGATAAKIAVIAGAVTYAVGAAGAAFAGLPAIIGAAVVSFAVFKLGMEGIKRAYESSLKPAIDAMKTQIEGVFERTLAPAFQRLSEQLIPRITNEMSILAQAFADGGVQIIDMVNKSENIAKIEQLISNTAQQVRGQLVPALQSVIQAIIDIGANGAILRDMVGIFSDLINKTSAWLQEMNRTGEAERAVSNLRSVLSSVEDLFFRLLTGAVQFFNEATPGMERLLDSITPTESVMRKLGDAFGTAAGAAGDLIASIPPSAFDAIADSAQRFSDKLSDLANNQEFQGFVTFLVEQIPKAIDVFTNFTGAVETLSSVLGPVIGFVSDLTGKFPALGSAVEGALNPIGKAAENIRLLGEKLGIIEPAASDAGAGIESGFIPPVEGLPAKTDAAFTGVQTAADKLKPLPGTAAAAGAGVKAGIENNINPLPGTADAAFGGVNAAGDKLQPLPGTAAAAAQGANAGVESGLAPMPGTADAAFQGVTDAAKTGMDGAVQAAESGGTRMSDAIKKAVDAASQAATQGMPKISEAVTSAMDAAGQSAETGGQRIGDGIRNGVQAATDAVNAQMPAIGNTVESAMQAAGAAAETGGQRIGDGIRTGAEAAASAVEAAMPKVSAAVEKAMSAAEKAATDGGKRISDGLKSSIDSAASAVEAGMAKIPQTVARSMQQAVQSATQGGRAIEQALRASLTAVVQVVTQAWQRIVQAFQQGGQRAVQIARQTGQQIVATFTALAGPMFSAGFQIISRLAAGMVAAQGQAFAAAASTAAGIRARFPASPAKTGPLSGSGDPLRSGGTIIQRLAAGMAANAAAVQAALQPILAGVVARVNSVAANPMVDAAREILARIQSRGQLFEDLSWKGMSWKGMSSNAARYNDALLDAKDSSGIRDTKAFLEDYIRRNTTTASSAADGGVLGELRAQTSVLVAMRADLAASGYGPDMLARLDQLIAAATSDPAGPRTQRQRSLAVLGAFG